MSQIPAWKQYQENVAAFFRGLGFDAQTDVSLKGVRTHHAIDVLVRSSHAGLPLLWAIECKHWNTAVSKLHVLGLREIVSEIGADRGIVLSESGFQSGAIEASYQTNVHLSSLAQLKVSTAAELAVRKLNVLYERYGRYKEQFWEIPKYVRVAYHLRSEGARPGEHPGFMIFQFADEVLFKAIRGSYPIEDAYLSGSVRLQNSDEVIATLEPLLDSLGERLSVCMADKANWPIDEEAAYARLFKSMELHKAGGSAT